MTTLTLPFPPTVNNLYKNVRKGRVRTEGYDTWLASAYAALRGQRFEKHSGSYRMRILLERPDRRRRDASNYVKATEDFLVKAGVIEDDSAAQSVWVAWAWDRITPGGAMTVAIEPAEFPIFLMGGRAA